MTRKMLHAAGALLALALVAELSPAQNPAPVRRLPVYLRVLLPDEDVTLTIEDMPTRQTGTNRLFVSPPLEPGRTYTYSLAMNWQPNNYTDITRSRKVAVRAGQEVEVDLRQPDDKNPDKVLIRYVPTPEEVVEAMCKLAGVTKDDVVYDLGCGDGRIVVTAVKQYGAKRGVGVDIDPDRIKESKEGAKAAGVADRVEFRQQDVLTLKDIGDASVVMLYMGDEMNLLLRPILRKTLKPGTRIVSHRFLMGDWKPDKTETVTDSYGGEYDIHLWKIGADGGKKD